MKEVRLDVRALLAIIIVVSGVTAVVMEGLINAQKDADDCALRMENFQIGLDRNDKLRDAWEDDADSWEQAETARRAAADAAEPGSDEFTINDTAADQYKETARNNDRRADNLQDPLMPDCSTTPDYLPVLPI